MIPRHFSFRPRCRTSLPNQDFLNSIFQFKNRTSPTFARIRDLRYRIFDLAQFARTWKSLAGPGITKLLGRRTARLHRVMISPMSHENGQWPSRGLLSYHETSTVKKRVLGRLSISPRPQKYPSFRIREHDLFYQVCRILSHRIWFYVFFFIEPWLSRVLLNA